VSGENVRQNISTGFAAVEARCPAGWNMLLRGLSRPSAGCYNDSVAVNGTKGYSCCPGQRPCSWKRGARPAPGLEGLAHIVVGAWLLESGEVVEKTKSVLRRSFG